MQRFGFVRVTTVSPVVHVGNPRKNVNEIFDVLPKLSDSEVVVFPELCITGYTCGDLFLQQNLLDEAEVGVAMLLDRLKPQGQLIVVGCPVRVDGSLYNCLVFMEGRRLLGIIPKQFLPNYKEFYEKRWFKMANGTEPKYIPFAGDSKVPFGIDLLFQGMFRGGMPVEGFVVSGENCEDLWKAIQPSAFLSVAGATILVNTSASNETVGKADYRRSLVVGQSARCIAAYIYSCAGPTESSTDVTFPGHLLIAENGTLMKESERFVRETHWETADIDVEKLLHERRVNNHDDCARYLPFPYRRIFFEAVEHGSAEKLERYVTSTPFIPSSGPELNNRCRDIFEIMVAGAIKRWEQLPRPIWDKNDPNYHNPDNVEPVHGGISGGLDSTLAALAWLKGCDRRGFLVNCSVAGQCPASEPVTARSRTPSGSWISRECRRASSTSSRCRSCCCKKTVTGRSAWTSTASRSSSSWRL